MAETSKLVRFVVELVADAGTRERFHGGDAATRDQMMTAAGLNDAEKAAIRESNSDEIIRLMNIQIVGIPSTKRIPTRKPARKTPKTPKKKAPKKGGRAKGRKATKKR